MEESPGMHRGASLHLYQADISGRHIRQTYTLNPQACSEARAPTSSPSHCSGETCDKAGGSGSASSYLLCWAPCQKHDDTSSLQRVSFWAARSSRAQPERGDSHVRDAEGIEEARAQNRPQTVEQHVAQIPALVVRGCWLGEGNLIGNIIIGT